MANLERGARPDRAHGSSDIRLVVITHAHIDHCGQAPPIAERAGCEVWMHPRWKLHAAHPPDLDRTIEVALPERRARGAAAALGRAPARPPAAARPGTLVLATATSSPASRSRPTLGAWDVIETPGHAPSHVCLHQPERRLLISGDHLLGRVSQYFDVGYTPDPVGEFLHSLDVVDALDARLALAGHARPFTDVRGHIEANRELVRARPRRRPRARWPTGQRTAYELARAVYGEQFTEEMASWQMTMTTAWLQHLEALGEAGDPVGRRGSGRALGNLDIVVSGLR